MAVIKYVTGYPETLLEDVNAIKQSGVKCVNAEETPLVETATGKEVHMCYTLTFVGNLFQIIKARKIMDGLHHGESSGST